jgi:hypothetical protein
VSTNNFVICVKIVRFMLAVLCVKVSHGLRDGKTSE